jgi:hypothetical protein
MEPPTLPLENMADRHIGLTPEVAAYWVQAAHVCLDRHHTSPTEFFLCEEPERNPANVIWEATDARMRGAWANEIDTTEAGAYACALATVEVLKGMFAVRRAETRTGADYYVGPAGQGLDDLENCFRLDVGGNDRGSESYVAGLLRRKVQQTIDGESNLPALAAAVGFQAKLVMLQVVEEDS